MNDIERAAHILIERLSGEISSPKDAVPVGISNRHIHLSEDDLYACFGENYALTPTKELSQPGQFACRETMTVCGPKGVIERVRVLGPVRKQTQVELLASDTFKLGVRAPLRLSGDLADSAGVTLVGPAGSVFIRQGAIIAKRHIHMTPADAERFGVHDGQSVAIEIPGGRGGILDDVIVRVSDESGLELHIDTEEANALGVNASMQLRMIKQRC